MKSPMVTNLACIPDKSGYTDMRVLKSAAGWYVGTLYRNVEADGTVWHEPGSRDSDYFPSEEAAEAFLKCLEGTSDEVAAIVTRNHP